MSRAVRGLLACLAGLAAAGAGSVAVAAECPVAGDLARGIRLVLEDGEAEVFRAVSDAVVESRLSRADGAETRFTYARGVYLLASEEWEAGAVQPASRATFAYPMRPEATPAPAPGHGWGVTIAARYDGAPVQEMLGLRFGAATEVAIGACRFEALPVETRIYEAGELVAREDRSYLPGLGFSFAVAWHEDDRVDRYVYKAIEAVE